MIVVMTVNFGYGGQTFIPEMLDKIIRLRLMPDERNIDVEIEVDGGVSVETAPEVIRAGGNVLVARSAIFNNKESVAKAMERMKKAVAVTTG